MSIAINNKFDPSTLDYTDQTDTGDSTASQAAATAGVSGQVAAQAASGSGTAAPLASASTYAAANSAISGPSAARSSATTIASSVPDVPEPKVTGSLASANRQAASFISNFSLSNSEAFRIIEEMGQKNYALDAQLTNAANSAVIGAKEQQVRDTQAQIEGDRKSAVTQFVGGMAASGIGLGAGYAGRKWRDSPAEQTEASKVYAVPEKNTTERKAAYENFAKAYVDARDKKGGITAQDDKSLQAFDQYLEKKRTPGEAKQSGSAKRLMTDVSQYFNPSGSAGAMLQKSSRSLSATFSSNKVSYGSALDGSAQSLAQLTNQAVGLVDRFAGGQYEHDQSTIALKVDDVNVAVAQQVLDSAKSRQDRDLQDVDKGIDALKDMMSRYAGLADKW